MANDNLYEVVGELREIVSDLKRALYGDAATRSKGLMSELDGLRSDVTALQVDVQRLQVDVQRLQAQRPKVASWIAGYVVFCLFLVFLIAGIVNRAASHDAFGLPADTALGLAVLAAVAACVLFIVGFDWVRRA